jgi:1-aminocyclopropane-1-carboxylate deaminase
MKLDSFDRYPLLFGPSPLHPLERLSARLGGARLWAKREDCNSGLAFGGNKVRKLEYLVAEAIAQGCDTLVSIGGVQSNHTRQVAAVAASVGMKCVLIQESWVDWPDAVYDRVGNILLSRILGADVRLVSATFRIGFKESWERAITEIEASGGKPYAIPAGASDHRLGGLGFARWAQEVEQQERELGVFFDTVIVCSVTGSTQAGMIAGFAAQDQRRRIIGIDASAKAKATTCPATRHRQRARAMLLLKTARPCGRHTRRIPVDNRLDQLIGGIVRPHWRRRWNPPIRNSALTGCASSRWMPTACACSRKTGPRSNGALD